MFKRVPSFILNDKLGRKLDRKSSRSLFNPENKKQSILQEFKDIEKSV